MTDNVCTGHHAHVHVAIAEKELAQARPALEEAQQAVSKIKTAHLQELRALRSPPKPVRWTLEAVIEMLGLSCHSWQDIRKILQKKDFVPDVVNFQSQNLEDESLERVKEMLENEDFNEEKVSHASTACHSLFKWVKSQINMVDILRKVGITSSCRLHILHAMIGSTTTGNNRGTAGGIE